MTETHADKTATTGRRDPMGFREFMDEMRHEQPDLFEGERDIDGIVSEIEDYAARSVKRDGWRIALLEYLSEVAPLSRRAPPPVPEKPTPEQRATAKVESETHVKKLAGKAIAVILSMLTVNGKQIGDCDKADCLAHFGWWRELADRLKDGQRVRDVFTDAELFAIYQRHAGKPKEK